ncbi:hypothetical protein CHELA40_50011 [Chelatococcus asaccharovorans]|nr:hypothetical protein CHELA17_20857 [Chelatococcus asaccharovorans]CAH1690742.1 hypothetical protein CHELA40_50011 [Chelatococcus asaccharovorans]
MPMKAVAVRKPRAFVVPRLWKDHPRFSLSPPGRGEGRPQLCVIPGVASRREGIHEAAPSHQRPIQH